jgi:hypothetical protein
VRSLTRAKVRCRFPGSAHATRGSRGKSFLDLRFVFRRAKRDERRRQRRDRDHKQGCSLAEIAERLGDTKVVAAEHYVYAVGDYAEVDYAVTLDR